MMIFWSHTPVGKKSQICHGKDPGIVCPSAQQGCCCVVPIRLREEFILAG
jgi:hypothetical protein